MGAENLYNQCSSTTFCVIEGLAYTHPLTSRRPLSSVRSYVVLLHSYGDGEHWDTTYYRTKKIGGIGISITKNLDTSNNILVCAPRLHACSVRGRTDAISTGKEVRSLDPTQKVCKSQARGRKDARATSLRRGRGYGPRPAKVFLLSQKNSPRES